jgi:protein O-mannosyl-transferase
MKNPGAIRQQKSTSVLPARVKETVSPRTIFTLAVVFAAGVFAIYSPTLNFQFILDDHRFVSDPRLQSAGHVWEYFTNYVWAQVPGGPPSFYRPLFVLWLRLNFILSGISPWGWHLLSIAKHLSVAFLLGLLVWELLRDRVAALIAASLFALHPAHTESVAWVTVPDPLMAVAVLGSLLMYLRYAERVSADSQQYNEKPGRRSHKRMHHIPKGRPSVWWLIGSAAACLAALAAKETAIVLPVILFAVALTMPFEKRGRQKMARQEAVDFGLRLLSAFRKTLPFLGVTVIYLLCRRIALGGRLSSVTQPLPWTTVLLSWPATLWFYLKVLLWPARLRAFADPSLAEKFSVRVLLPGLGVCGAVAILVWGCVRAWRRARCNFPNREAVGVKHALLLGSLILVLPIVPALNLNVLNPGDFLHGRYTYLPLAGLMIILAVGWRLTGWRRAKKGQAILLSAMGIVAVAFSVLTVKQERAWKDDLTLFTVAHQIAPHNGPVAQNLVRAHVQIALGLDEAGRCDQAVPIFEQAIQQYPQDWFAWAGLGECLFKLNDLSRAEQSLRRASELSHESRVKEEWQQVRAKMGLSSVLPE